MRHLLYIIGISLWSISATVSSATLTIQITDIQKDEKGTLMVGVYDKATTFLQDEGRVAEAKLSTASAQEGVMVVKIDQLTLNKEYAIAAFHDANNNGRLDKNWFGLPTEGYGFSLNARSMVGPPDFNEAAIKLTQENQSVRFKLSY